MNSQPAPPPPGSPPGSPNKPPTESGSCLVTCLIALAVGAGVLLLVLFLGGLYVWYNGPRLVSGFARRIVAEIVQKSDLPEEEKQAIMVQIDRVDQLARDGKITTEQLGRVMERVVQSPIITLIPVSVFKAVYLEKSGLDEEQRAQVQRQLQRVARGAVERKISEDELKGLLDLIADRKPGTENEWEMKKSLSDEEILEFADACRAMAEQHEIPDEPYEFKISEELRKIIDEALDPTSAQQVPSEDESLQPPEVVVPETRDDAAEVAPDASLP